MQKGELAVKIAGVALSTLIGIAGLVIDSKKTTKITEEDKNDIAKRSADEVIRLLAVMPTEVIE